MMIIFPKSSLLQKQFKIANLTSINTLKKMFHINRLVSVELFVHL